METEIQACPGCGCEPEVTNYYRDIQTKIRRGYQCTCGAIVIDGIMIGASVIT